MIRTTPPDGGSLYAETNLSQPFPEPFNAATSLLFLCLAIFWTWQISGQWRKFPFMAYALVLLYVGGIGGTIYHGFRRWPVFLIMDWLPIMLLCLSAGMWFFAKLTRWYVAGLLIFVYLILQWGLRIAFAENTQLFINTNYALLGSMVLIPVAAFLVRTKFRHGGWVGGALVAFALALFFRIADKWQILPMGTHFMWHVLGAVAAYAMLRYVYEVEKGTIQPE